MNDKAKVVRLPDELIEKSKDYARAVFEHYTSSDDWEANLPWTRNRLTPEQMREWLASRKQAGRSIDIETCELGGWYACDCDPYGILDMLGELPEEMRQWGRNRFVRSPNSRGWVDEGDLPTEKAHAMYDRIKRERG